MQKLWTVVKVILIATGFITWCFLLVLLGNTLPRTNVYNCELAEISPDYPREVVNECRKLRSKKSITA